MCRGRKVSSLGRASKMQELIEDMAMKTGDVLRTTRRSFRAEDTFSLSPTDEDTAARPMTLL
jgi:hypothetical protein